MKKCIIIIINRRKKSANLYSESKYCCTNIIIEIFYWLQKLKDIVEMCEKIRAQSEIQTSVLILKEASFNFIQTYCWEHIVAYL